MFLTAVAVAIGASGILVPRTASAQTTILHSFGGLTDGASPQSSGLIQAPDGNFYGTTKAGGITAGGLPFGSDQGTVFKMTPSGTVTILHAFTAFEITAPHAGLLRFTDGNFYGTASARGENGFGGIFKMTPAGALTEVFEFSGLNGSGSASESPLILGSDGNMYGMASGGGANGGGTMFVVTPRGFVAVIHSFDPATEGGSPIGPLVQGTDGDLYGVTTTGGVNGHGTVFKMSPPGTLTVLHAFAGAPADGARPVGLLRGADGNFYGTTSGGGTADRGTAFKMTPAGTVTLLHSFAGGSTDGWGPGPIIQGRSRNFYGSTANGGASGFGAVFQMTPTGIVTILHSFAGGSADGQNGTGPLLQAADGNLYGLTSGGGASGLGTIFRTKLNNVSLQTDFDGDGKADVAVWRQSNGTWYVRNSSTNTVTSLQFGTPQTVPVPGDYDGDGKTDFAGWDRSTGVWQVIYSSNSQIVSQQWGAGGAPYYDVPVPGDYDGDGKTDFAVWRRSTGVWYVHGSTGAFITRQWGLGFLPNDDVAVPGDYDGDGKTDLAVWRASTGMWYVIRSSDNIMTAQQWGAGFAPYNDVPVPGDYDGDGKTDIAVWRASTGTWYVIRSSNGSVAVQDWGAGYAPYNDFPVPSDYDGDGKTDFGVWRSSPGIWYVLRSSDGGVLAQQWGMSDAPYNDKPIPLNSAIYLWWKPY